MSSTAMVLMISMTIATQSSEAGEGWQRVAPKASGYSVLVPGKAEVKIMRQKADDGLADTHIIVAEVGGVKYVATMAEIRPPITPDKQDEFFDEIKRAYAQSKGRTLKREQRGGKLHGMPICFFNVNAIGPDGKTRNEQSRFLLGDPTHTLTLQVVIPAGVEVNDDVRRFFNSLEYDPGRAVKPASPASVAARWRAFSPAGKGFAVQMPGEAKSEHKDLPDGSVGIDSYEANLGDRVFSVAVYAIPPAAAEQPPGVTLENLGKGIVGGMKGTLGAINPAPRDGLEGRDAIFGFANPDTGEPAEGRLVAYADGARLFVLLYGGPKGSSSGAEVVKFLDSFRATGKPAPVGPKKPGRPWEGAAAP